MKEVSISAAQESFGTAVTMLESTAKYWIAWGNTFDQQLKASGPAGASLQSEQGARYAEHFIRCILRAVRLQPEAAKLLLSRVIFLLQCEPANAAILDAFSSGVDACPSLGLAIFVAADFARCRGTEPLGGCENFDEGLCRLPPGGVLAD